MNDVNDLKQRQRALNPAESFIVQAPAGSGKTELLIQRYLQMLSLVNAPEEIVAITFTRKAAAEMRGRIINALEQVAYEQPAADAAAEITHRLAAQVIAQDAKQEWQLLDNPGRLRIQTIDSLTASLTRQMPILSGFGAQPETLENASEVYQLAAANTLAELESGDAWSDSIAILLRHLDNDLPRVRNMLADMLARRDQWLRHIGKHHQREELEASLAHLVESVLSQAAQCLPLKYHAELLALLRFAADNLHDSGIESLITTGLDIEKMPGAEVGDLDKWKAITSLLFTIGDTWRKTANVNLGFPAASGNSTQSEARFAMKSRFSALLANLSAEQGLAAILIEITYLPPARYSDSEWQVVEALYQLLILADAQLRMLFAERNQMDFSGITQAAIQALGNADIPSYLAMQLDYQIKHIFVDEFQDISTNQFTLLEKLTEAWSADDEHSLFLVGDPMQSIYRFREAEVGLFLNTWDQRRLNQVPLTPLRINVNFRSGPGIVEWINQVFEQVLPEVANVTRGAVNYVRADAYHSQDIGNSVQIHPNLSRNDEREADLVLRLVQQAKQTAPQDNIAILVRSRSHLREIVPKFKQLNLPYRAVEIEAMGQRAAIQDLLALTLALTHFADRIAWLAILRAPWCGLTLMDLHRLVADSKSTAIWECMQDSLRVQSLSEDGRQRLTRFNNILILALADQGRRRLNRWVESVWMNIGGPASLENESDLENSLAFFQLLDDFDESGDLKDREVFSEKVSLLYAAPDIGSEDAVQIMTIHKAKGLEFDTVILPGLSKGAGADEARLLLWMETPHGSHQDLLLAPVKEVGTSESLIYNYLKSLENEKQTYELGRLLYVAATRAKKQLHIIATAEVGEQDDGIKILSPRRNSLLAQLWPAVEDIFESVLENHQPGSDIDGASAQKNQRRLRRLDQDWTLPLATETLTWQGGEIEVSANKEMSIIEYDWAGETIKHVGTAVHRCIQWLAEQRTEDWDTAEIEKVQHIYQALLKHLGVADKELNRASLQVQQALTNMVEDDRGKWLFLKEHKNARNEYAISGLHHGKVVNVVLDRTFVDSDGVRWVVDYKTSRHEGGDREAFLDQQQQRYQEQLEKYGMLMRAMEDRPVKLGLYFPLLQGWREWNLA